MDDLPVTRAITIPGWELVMRTMRSSGPGGQGVNTTDSKVEIRWNIPHSSVVTEHQKQRLQRKLRSRLTDDGDLIVRADDERSQHRNREIARERLATLIRDGLTVQQRRRTSGPSRNQKRKRLEAKRQHSEKKQLRKRPEL